MPGLRAKPVIDIDVVLRGETDVEKAIGRLSSLGYTHLGDQGIPGRQAFMWPDGTPRHHLYTVTAHNQAHRDHIDFRDYLRTHPETAQEYADLKDRLAARYRTDRLAYTNAKAAFIFELLGTARR